MKNLLLSIVVLGCVGFIGCNQNDDVPEQVLKSFAEMFPQADDAEWEMENENDWEVEFEFDGKEMSACFTPAGDWLETETELEVEDLPRHIIAAFENDYKDYEIDEAEWIESADFQGYELEFEKGENDIELYLAESGKIVKVVNNEDDD